MTLKTDLLAWFVVRLAFYTALSGFYIALLDWAGALSFSWQAVILGIVSLFVLNIIFVLSLPWQRKRSR